MTAAEDVVETAHARARVDVDADADAAGGRRAAGAAGPATPDPWWRARRLEGEWMDEPDIEPALLAHALRDLDRLNRWTRTSAGLAAGVRRVARLAGGPDAQRPVTVLDLGCGGGGVTRALHGALERAAPAVAWRVVGVDASATCIATATAAAAAAAARRKGTAAALASALEFRTGRVGRDELAALAGGPVDIVVSSLFLHHLDDTDIDGLLRACAVEARAGVVMDDLRRDRRAMALVRIGTRIGSRCPVVHVDGLRSVRAALAPAELQRRAEHAGLSGARVRGGGPARMRLEWVRPRPRTGAAATVAAAAGGTS